MSTHWDRAERTDRWHTLWVDYLRAQTALNPNHPADQEGVRAYERAAQQYRAGTGGDRKLWDDQVDRVEERTRHDVVAALQVFNSTAHRSWAHTGLASSDIVDVANQWGIADAFHDLLRDVRGVVHHLDRAMLQHAQTRLVARTHGQPAQLTTWGHRVATVLGPLLDWYERANAWADRYPMRPPHGAVGTGADLVRALTGWQPTPDGSTMASGGQRSDSERSPGMSTPPGASEGSGGTVEASSWPSVVAIAEQTDEEGWQQFRERILARFGSSHDDWYAVFRAEGKSKNEAARLAVANAGRVVQKVGTGETLTEGSLIGDTSYRCAEPPSVFDSSDQSTVRQGSTESGPYDAASPDDLMGIYTAQIAARTGFTEVMDTTRQVYHRSIDLHTSALLAELASIAQTWATDRRLESMLGLGTETKIDTQVGSSSMPHKDNPRYTERMCALAVVTRCYLTASAETAGMEWFEGDVSTSAARRIILPGMFDAAHRLVQDWLQVVQTWGVREHRMDAEVENCSWEISTGALIHAATERGMSRGAAHEAIRKASTFVDYRGRIMALIGGGIWPMNSGEIEQVIRRVVDGPIGTVTEQIHRVHERAIGVTE